MDGILSALETRCAVTGSPAAVASAVTLGGKLRTLLSADSATQMHSILTDASRVSLITCVFDTLPMYRLYRLLSPLPSARQHPSMVIVWRVKREYYQNCSVLDCVTQCSQSAAHLCEHFLQVQQVGFVTLGPLRCA